MRALCRRKELYLAAAVLAVCSAAYVGAYFKSVKRVSVTFIDARYPEQFRFRCAYICYFSGDPRLNRLLYTFFYPLHREKATRVEGLRELFTYDDQRGFDKLCRGTVYAPDIEYLRKAGLRMR